MRHAFCASAHASQVLPTPVGPTISTVCPRSIHSPCARLAIFAASSPRLERTSRSSSEAWPYLSRARASRRFSRCWLRHALSRSTSSARRSSNARLAVVGSVSCSSNALAMPSSFSAFISLRVCCTIIRSPSGASPAYW
jgi:hypothetical protein